MDLQEFQKLNWKDHISERPGTFKEVLNSDGTVTHIPEEGEVLQEGTPVSANNLNHMDEGIYKANKQAKINKDDITSLAVEVAILKNAALNNFTHNIFVVNLDTLNSIDLMHGVWDPIGKRVVV